MTVPIVAAFTHNAKHNEVVSSAGTTVGCLNGSVGEGDCVLALNKLKLADNDSIEGGPRVCIVVGNITCTYERSGRAVKVDLVYVSEEVFFACIVLRDLSHKGNLACLLSIDGIGEVYFVVPLTTDTLACYGKLAGFKMLVKYSEVVTNNLVTKSTGNLCAVCYFLVSVKCINGKSNVCDSLAAICVAEVLVTYGAVVVFYVTLCKTGCCLCSGLGHAVAACLNNNVSNFGCTALVCVISFTYRAVIVCYVTVSGTASRICSIVAEYMLMRNVDRNNYYVSNVVKLIADSDSRIGAFKSTRLADSVIGYCDLMVAIFTYNGYAKSVGLKAFTGVVACGCAKHLNLGRVAVTLCGNNYVSNRHIATLICVVLVTFSAEVMCKITVGGTACRSTCCVGKLMRISRAFLVPCIVALTEDDDRLDVICSIVSAVSALLGSLRKGNDILACLKLDLANYKHLVGVPLAGRTCGHSACAGDLCAVNLGNDLIGKEIILYGIDRGYSAKLNCACLRSNDSEGNKCFLTPR